VTYASDASVFDLLLQYSSTVDLSNHKFVYRTEGNMFYFGHYYFILSYTFGIK
jgi:hypothetical protein